ncbi:intermembrane transport protein PqiB [Pragia fontium]|uniref:Paraquat-inducible protein B n=2 Tax=Pragia fontium TaxID=82985 RepID=A0AAJ5BHX3_9GAMM|nr:intermembrane transport protein PqiB [Pragia fontium]AKJ42595.1 paraquat-inducible protein B [Pragia fontium]GKX62570.1 paraquat-inducible protein B [Pragia fontium]SFD12902.1 paraquat-inducible protein B [Pragia fontium DSM 5563 = ATCC 49100]VEJ55827.1 paraquat-inducible protein B [Pragia fontium]
MQDNYQDVAKIEKIKRWSPVWIIPIVTVLIGAWILFYHFSTQGPKVTLIAVSAEGIDAGKTAIKSRNVDIGMVETVNLSEDLKQVIITARLHDGMEKLLNKGSVFWVVKPQIGREGVSGLSTLLSGAYIELLPGQDKQVENEFTLQDAAPLASSDTKGLRIELESKQPSRLNAGDPVLFRGFRVGTVESSEFDAKERVMRYKLFIMDAYRGLVTSNVRFWQDSGIAFDMSSQGVRVEMASLDTLVTGGVSFDLPNGWSMGDPVKDLDEFELYADQKSIQESLYTRHEDFLLYFEDSIRGLIPGAPVEFRGIRVGTVSEVPFYMPELKMTKNKNYYVPVLIRIEPDRIQNRFGKDFDLKAHLLSSVTDNGLRASLKTGNLLTGSLFVDLDFYPDAKPWKGPKEVYGHPLIPSVSGGLTEIQKRLMQVLDKVNNMPVEPMLAEMTQTLKETRKTMASLNAILSSKETNNLPKDMQKTLNELNRSLKGFQPGSTAYSSMVSDMQRLEQVMRELQPILQKLNQKSNALVFEAPSANDPQPKKANSK